MKKAFALWFGLALSLLAGRSGAQLDSNAKVSLDCSRVCDQCNMTVTGINSIPPGETTYYQQSESLCTGYSGSFRLADMVVSDSAIYGFSEQDYSTVLNLELDTVNSLLRYLSIQTTYNYSTNFTTSVPGGFNALVIRFDSIRYRDSSGNLLIRGVFLCRYGFHASVLGGYLHWFFSGGCSDSGVTTDTMSLQIVPNGYLEIASTQESKSSAFVISDDGNSFVCSYESSPVLRALRLFNILGQTIAVYSIPSNSESAAIPIASISPGCYFARLGDQVAKFVVPPR